MSNYLQLFYLSNNSTNSTKPCTPTVNYKLYLHFSVIPAVFIMALLSLYTKRVKKRDCWNGVPGLLIPINFFTSQRRRLTIALAFGASAGSILPLLVRDNALVDLGKASDVQWMKSFIKLLNLVEIGIIYFPIMACLTFKEEILLPSLLGFLYTLPRFAVELRQVLDCPDGDGEIYQSIIPFPNLLIRLPVILCLFFVSADFFISFAKALYEHFHTRMVQPPEFRDLPVATLPPEEEPIGRRHDYHYVFKLLCKLPPCNYRPWYKCLLYFFYQPKKEFKFSIQIIATIVVSCIVVYQLELGLLIIGEFLYKIGERYSEELGKVSSKLLHTFGMAVLIGSLVITAYIAIIIVNLFSSHREKMMKLWRGNRRFLPDRLPSPASMVRLSLRYSGYQIAYVFWGFTVMNLIMMLITGIVSCLVVFWPYVPEVFDIIIRSILLGVAPYFVFFLIVWIIQYLISYIALRDYSFPNITVNINNPRIYHIANFMFFFYGAIVGVGVAFGRIIKALILGIALLPRIDHNSLMEGYHLLDNGYMAYLGFLFISAAQHNPVLRVFCQLLLDEKKKKAVNVPTGPFLTFKPSTSYGTLEEEAGNSRQNRPRISRKALNHWFLACLLIKNPKLIQYRKYVRYPELLIQ